jgi:dsDNA-specific endonuclease/ATPase MutS2
MDYLGDGWDFDRFLEENQENQRQRLEAELERIQNQLDRRDELNEELLDEMSSKLDWYLKRLEEEYRSHGSSNVDELKSEVKRFYSLIRSEKQEHWNDKQRLERERRQLLREINELTDLDFQDLL